MTLSFGIPEIRPLERAAKSAGKPLASYVKSCAMQAHGGRADPPEAVVDSLSELHRLVRNIANNVNQMARQSNTIGQVLDEHEVFASIQALQAAYEDAIRKAGEHAPADADDDGHDHGSGQDQGR